LEVDIQQGNFKILRLPPQALILFWVDKWIPPSRSKTAEIGQKIEGILGVKFEIGIDQWIIFKKSISRVWPENFKV
jgi:hypothetical protein